jgi:hypothetical protein
MRALIGFVIGALCGCSSSGRPECLTPTAYFPDVAATAVRVDGGTMLAMSWKQVPQVPAAFYLSPVTPTQGVTVVDAGVTGVELFAEGSGGGAFQVEYDEQLASATAPTRATS